MSTDDARSRLLDAAGPIFAEKGFKNATVREICHAAGVNVASVNYYFGDKQRLYVETVKRAHPLHTAPRFVPPWEPDAPAPERLAALVRTMATHMLGAKTQPWQSQLLARETMNPSSACRELVEEFIRQRFEMLSSILDEILPAGTPAHQRHLIALSIVAQFVYFRAARRVIEMLVGPEEIAEHHRAEQVVDHVLAVTFAILGLGPPLTSGPEPGQGISQRRDPAQRVADEKNSTVAG